MCLKNKNKIYTKVATQYIAFKSNSGKKYSSSDLVTLVNYSGYFHLVTILKITTNFKEIAMLY